MIPLTLLIQIDFKIFILESKLHKANLLEEHRSANEYFLAGGYHGGIEDDHIPFLRKGQFFYACSQTLVYSSLE